ncbi:FAD-dependent oxidoreductase [Arthrobacter sp. NicSoilC5]|uniref:NAD(P)/FAD-dependent oxidoreductase n=1 Tax=Arthrobacter sp. NicSoilC5 TaxID=2831000 RepID=UPI001CC38F15|nr:FAD-dependent oxidoreductase [Arthrobacter sp. NicSoilC5]BCW78351.1 pyridine nucleotide-disulphide oxidoreductase family protein [Arthrobacter sp. NicSoilC5]
MSAGTVIVGAGQAGAQLATSLRENGYPDGIALIGDEPHTPYHRPPLSKEYMAGGIAGTELPIRTAEYYQGQDIWLRTGAAVSSIDRGATCIVLATGERMPYEHLVLATGSRNRRLSFDDSEPANVHYLRTRDDAARLRSALTDARNVLIVGAGFIGLEFASVAVGRGARVTVVEMADRVMGRAVSTEISAHFTDRHTATGVKVLCSTSIDEFVRSDDGLVTALRIHGQLHDADLVLVGIGVIPNAELAQDAGLTVDNGIVVDSSLATTDPSIFAIGDCASHPRPESSGRVRVESVQNAADQARFLARQLCAATEELNGGYKDVPWFWSHQAGDKLQIAGLSQPGDQSLILGDPATGRFSVCRLRDDQLVAIESINSPGDHLASRKLLASGLPLDEAQLSAPGFSLRTALSAATLTAAPTSR